MSTTAHWAQVARPRAVASAAVAGTALVAVLGIVAGAALEPESLVWKLFHLDFELGVPALWSGLLLAAGGVAAVLLRRITPWSAVLGVLLLVLAADEVVLLHERLERASGVDWQVLYAPVALLGGAAVVGLAAKLWGGHSGTVLVLFAGFGCWAVSQLLEQVQWEGDTKVAAYEVLMTVEEVLEMAGSLLVLLALLVPLGGALLGSRAAADQRGA